MRPRTACLRTALAAALLALAVWGLFAQAAALPAGGYGLRLAAPLSAAQAETLRTAAAARGAAAVFWREEKGAEIKTAFPGKEPEEAFAAARTASARAVYISGGVALAFPVRYVAGTAPGAGQADGCAVSTALADTLFGSREAVGLALAVNGETRRITGVFAAQEAAVLCPVTSAGGCTAVELTPAAGSAR